nr:reverse transcriptase domain-containing protein [Tanacetum cinerariifolium]
MVKKHDGSWRMCVDFTDLNRACLQDCYPLLKIDWKVESLCGYPFKCFLDAYKGYHQIQLAEADQEKIAFHIGQGEYCYTKMPFGLKNAGATYQRLMDKAFESQVGRNIEVYVDDLVVKSHTEAEMVRDIEEMFQTLRKVNMKLNPKKCSFGLAKGVFLGKISTVVSDLKKCIKKSDFCWTAEAEQAFQQLKQHLLELPLLVAPKPQEELIMYLSATYGAVSAQRGSDSIFRLTLSRSLLTNPSSRSRTSVTGKILANFLIKMSGDVSQAAPAVVTQEEPWTLFTDGSSCVDGLGAGLILTNQEGVEFIYALRFQFAASNNEAEYEALVLVEVLENKSIKEKEVAAVIEKDGPTCMTQIADYLKEGVLPGDNKEARKLLLKAHQYELIEGVLYRRSLLTPWLRCVGPLQADNVMREIHEGSCRNRHSRPLFGRAGEGQVPDSQAKAVATITGGQVKKFVWDNIETEAVIPVEIRMPTYRTAAVDVVNNDKELRLNLDLLEERRERAAVCKARAKSNMMKYYNARVRGVAFNPGDFVYRNNDASHAVAGAKLGPKWEGPHEVTEALSNGAYKLRSTDGTVLPRT